jgi:predicted transcriptional regulator
MAYDAKLDKSLFSKPETIELDQLTVSVYSYNNGPKKLQISRNCPDNQGELKFAKLGRMTKAEVEAILPLIKEALAHM